MPAPHTSPESHAAACPRKEPLRRAARVGIVLAVAAAVAGAPVPALACSCAPVDRRTQVPATAVIFVGELASAPMPVDTAGGPTNGGAVPVGAGRVEYRFRVVEALKGDPKSPLAVRSPASPAACGASFFEGQRYLVFANEGKDGGLATTLCDFAASGTELEEAVAEVRRILAEPAGEK